MDSIVDFLENNKYVEKVSRIVSLANISFIVDDYKIRGDIDENIYLKDKNLWENLPRAFCIIKKDNKILRCVSGLRKFGNEGEFLCDLKPDEIFKEEIYLNKVNGEYFSISSFNYEDTEVFILRSKNVSMLLRENFFEEDLKVYTESRYQYVFKMSNLFIKFYNSLKITQKEDLIRITRENTINLEYCSPDFQHLIDYHNQEKMFPFAITKMQPSDLGLTTFHPITSQQIFENIGFDRFPYVFIVENLNDSKKKFIREQIFTEDNSEGSVVYKIALDTKTNNMRVFEVYKYKNYHYVFWRAVREKMRVKATLSQLKKRLRSLHCEVPNFEVKEREAIQFYSFCWKNIDPKNWMQLFNKWVDYFKIFKSLSIDQKEKLESEFLEIDRNRSQYQLMTIALPGSGKSTLLKSLEFLIPHSIRINQDECNRSAKIYHKKVKQFSNQPNFKFLLLDKCYHNRQVRQGTINSLNLQNMIYIIFYHPDDQKDLECLNLYNINQNGFDNALNLVKQRINSRGNGHLNLFPSPELEGILLNFIKSFEPLSENEINLSMSYILVDMTKTKEEVLKHIIDSLKELGIIDKDFSDQEQKEAIQKVQESEENLKKRNK